MWQPEQLRFEIECELLSFADRVLIDDFAGGGMTVAGGKAVTWKFDQAEQEQVEGALAGRERAGTADICTPTGLSPVVVGMTMSRLGWHSAQTYKNKVYAQVYTAPGATLAPKPTLRERLSASSVAFGSCRLWQAARQIRVNGVSQLVWRVAYGEYVGVISGTQDVAQSCGSRYCIAPEHLVLVPRARNKKKPS